jgi:hypothetical protein
LISLLKALRSLPTNVKEADAYETRIQYLEKLYAKKMTDSEFMNIPGEGWTEQKEKCDEIGSLEDLRKLEGGN